MKLIYRAQIIEYNPALANQDYRPHAINWRYQVSGESCNSVDYSVLPHHKVRALNWRFQPV